MKDWQQYALGLFGVVAGQVLVIGRKIDKGQPVTWRDLFVLCSLLPAYGALVGAAAQHFGWAVLPTLATGIAAGWLGFGAMRYILTYTRQLPGLPRDDDPPKP